ncbi:hypothetical protein K438DRAFT_1988605 [Mycena galopus ATCC 62051]|nr:hypothetical protein K438DRAFT_1988605 [Mycena galopus ATCC 62051]
MSTSFLAFQMKVNNFHKWGANKRAFVSAKKSKWMIFSPLPADIPTLWCGETAVKLVFEFKYVGVWFTSTHRNIFARHYAVKASKARATSNVIFALKHRVSSLPMREALVLYMVRVDCYLILGGELALDTDTPLLQNLQDVQHAYLHRLLGLNPHSMLASFSASKLEKTDRSPFKVNILRTVEAHLATSRITSSVSGSPVPTLPIFAETTSALRARWRTPVGIVLVKEITCSLALVSTAGSPVHPDRFHRTPFEGFTTYVDVRGSTTGRWSGAERER